MWYNTKDPRGGREAKRKKAHYLGLARRVLELLASVHPRGLRPGEIVRRLKADRDEVGSALRMLLDHDAVLRREAGGAVGGFRYEIAPEVLHGG